MKIARYVAAAVCLIAAVAVAAARGQWDAHRPHRQVIVANRALTAQTAPIPTTTLYTPKRDGIFRVTIYFETTTLGDSGVMCGSIGFEDDAAVTSKLAEFDCIDLVYPNNEGRLTTASQSIVIRDKAGTPITFQTFVGGPSVVSGDPVYAIFFTVEQLQ